MSKNWNSIAKEFENVIEIILILKKLQRQYGQIFFFFILSNVKVSIKCQQRFYLVYYQSLNIKYHVDNEQVKSQLNKCCVWLVSFCDIDFIFLLFQWLSLGVLCQTPATEGRERAHPSWRGCGSSCQEVSVIIAKTCSY